MTVTSTQWSKESRYLVLSVGLVLLALLINYMAPVIPPLIVGALLAYLLSPVVGGLHNKFKWNRTLAVIVVYSVAFLLIFGVLPSVGVPLLIEQGIELQDELVYIVGEVDKNLQALAEMDLPFELDRIPEIPYDLITEQLNPDSFFNLLGHATKNILYFLLVMFSSLFFLLDWPKLKKWLLGLAPQRFQDEAADLMDNVVEVWNAYLRGTLLMSLMVGTTTWISLIAMGVKSPLALAFLAAVGDMLPKLGPLTVMIVVSLVALFGGSTLYGMTNFWFFVLVLSVTAVIQITATFIVRPRILGGRMHLHPGVVIVAILTSLAISGVILALIIVPLLSSISILMKYIWVKVVFYRDELPQEELE